MMRTSNDNVLCISGLNVKIKDNHILRDNSFCAISGQILAILGPTGAGKTTLFKAIAGRQSFESGQVTLNGAPFNKQLRRKLGFVLQEDVFFSNLTLWETLYFTTMIRISEKVPYGHKLSKLNEVVDLLALRDCINTKIGDSLTGGLSGGEKKRVSIACELLTDPDMLLLDEPTSGIDASLAFSLMQQLHTLAKTTSKMIILSIHQPSSRIYNMFDSLIIMGQGMIIYFGEAQEAPLEFFRRFGLVCERFFNPADFYLEILKSDKDLNRFVKANCQSEPNLKMKSAKNVKTSSLTSIVTDYQTYSSTTSVSEKWPTTFSTQLKMLTRRNFLQSKQNILPVFDIIMYAFLCLCAGLVFFQIEEQKDSITDRLGLLYFYLVTWTFESMNQAIFAMHEERKVILKERASGAYRLSAYYIAKSVSELPLRIVMPALFYSIIYWVTGLGGTTKFFKTLPLALLNVLIAQSLGMFLSSVILNSRAAFLCGESIVLMGILFSGYITRSFPAWFSWSKYLSIIHYPLGAIATILFQDMDNVPCNATSTLRFEQCLGNETYFVTASDILAKDTIDTPLQCYVSACVLMFVIFRIATYVALRLIQKISS